MNESLEYAKLKAQRDYLQEENKQLKQQNDELKNELFESYLFEIKLINCIYYLYDTTH